MKIVKLTQNRYTFVSNIDYDIVSKHNWSVNSCNYVSCYAYVNGKRTFLTLHKLIMNTPYGMEVDHINGNRFDNRRSNLRLCTHSQNCVNRKSKIEPKSGFRGVGFHYGTNKWRAVIKVNQKKISLGLYFAKEEAARAYNLAALRYFGEFAWLNPIGVMESTMA